MNSEVGDDGVPAAADVGARGVADAPVEVAEGSAAAELDSLEDEIPGVSGGTGAVGIGRGLLLEEQPEDARIAPTMMRTRVRTCMNTPHGL